MHSCVAFAGDAGVADAVNRAELIDALGDVAVTRAPDSAQPEGGAIHMCPWHTCQATRHG